MGCVSSNLKGNHYLSCLENKKIIILKPSYLIFNNKFEYGKLMTVEPLNDVLDLT